MPSSVADICNRALSQIASQSFIASLDESSPEANYCKLWYDNIRQGLLRAATWGFARRQNVLAVTGDAYPDATSPYPWLWKYQYPADCLKFRYILPTPVVANGAIEPPQVGVGTSGWMNLTPSRSCRWLVNSEQDTNGVTTKSIISNVAQAIGVYTADITDVDQFDTLFESALTDGLSYKLCMPLSGNVGMRESFRAAAQSSINDALVADGNEALPTTDHVVDWMAARGAPTPFEYGAGLDTNSQWGSYYGSNDAMAWGA